MMDFKQDIYGVDQSSELFDIPAAEQEVTVGSNEQVVSMPSLLPSSGGSLLTHSAAPIKSATPIILSGGSMVTSTNVGGGLSLQSTGHVARGPKVLMLQRSSISGAGTSVSVAGGSVAGFKPGLKAVKIITVPGQGAGGKPLKAAVIPMHMLQRTMKVLPSSSSSASTAGALSGTGVITSGAGSLAVSRVLAIRSPASQMSVAGPGTQFLTSSTASTRSPSLLLSSSPGGTPSALQAALAAEEAVESHGISGTVSVVGSCATGLAQTSSFLTSTSVAGVSFVTSVSAIPGAGGATINCHPGIVMLNAASGELISQQPVTITGTGMMAAAGTTYYDMSTGLPAHLPTPAHIYGGHGSPSAAGRESGDEQEHVNTGLKTNGLRRYARCVCNKVKEKGTTSYSEVADELVHEYAAEHPMIPSEQLHYIQKNIRRRVYDALNVLMALNVLQKEKKEIRWVGLPVNMIEECRRLEEEREKRQVSLRNKTVEIQDLILQLIAFKNLVMRNRINERYRRSSQCHGEGPTEVGQHQQQQADQVVVSAAGGLGAVLKTANSALVNAWGPRTEKIPLPFLVISTHRKTVIDCNISNDKLEYLFNFDQAFEIRDEVDTLKRMGLMLRLGTIHCTQDEYNQCLELVPPSLRFYVEAIYERRQAIIPDFEALHQQRRLFVQARMAAAAAAVEASRNTGSRHVDSSHVEEDDEDALLTSSTVGRSMSHHSPLETTGHHHHSGGHHGPPGGHFHHSDLFDGVGAGAPTEEGSLRQLYLSSATGGDQQQRRATTSSSSIVASSCFVPGDTQHYARAAASRGYVVPGGPGGLLRHRQSSHCQAAARLGEYVTGGGDHHGVGSSSEKAVGGGGSLLRSVVMGGGTARRLSRSGDDGEEDVSAAATLVSGGQADSAGRRRGDIVDLMDTGEDPGVDHHHRQQHPEDEEDDDDDDEDMEEV